MSFSVRPERGAKRRVEGFAIVAAAVLLAGCPKSSSTTQPAAASAPPVATLMHGLWSGTANKSPLGIQPYAIEFRKQGAGVIGETPPTLETEVLPPGAYQYFHWKEGIAAAQVDYKTAMGSVGMIEGILERDATRSNAQRVIFCEPSACERMELRWESLAADKMQFQVYIDGKLHADIALAFEGDP